MQASSLLHVTHTRTNARTHACTHTHTHTLTLTHTHTYTYTLAHVLTHMYAVHPRTAIQQVHPCTHPPYWLVILLDLHCLCYIRTAAASFLQTLSITITAYSLSPNSFHPSTLSIINLPIFDLSSAKYLHLIINII